MEAAPSQDRHVVQRTLTFPADPDFVWQHARDLGRSLRPVGGVVIQARLAAIDDERRALEYSFVDFPFPISRNRVVIRVVPARDGQVTASCRAEFDADPDTADAMERFIGGAFESALMELAGLTNGSRRSR